MKPIEDAWDIMGSSSKSTQEFWRLVLVAQEEFRNIPQQHITNLVNSIRRRIQACILFIKGSPYLFFFSVFFLNYGQFVNKLFKNSIYV